MLLGEVITQDQIDHSLKVVAGLRNLVVWMKDNGFGEDGTEIWLPTREVRLLTALCKCGWARHYPELVCDFFDPCIPFSGKVVFDGFSIEGQDDFRGVSVIPPDGD